MWQEDVAHCQEQILLDTWVIVRDRGKWVGRKAPGSKGAKSVWDRKVTRALGLSWSQEGTFSHLASPDSQEHLEEESHEPGKFRISARSLGPGAHLAVPLPWAPSLGLPLSISS